MLVKGATDVDSLDEIRQCVLFHWFYASYMPNLFPRGGCLVDDLASEERPYHDIDLWKGEYERN